MSIATDEVQLRSAEHLTELYQAYLYWRGDQDKARMKIADEPTLDEFMRWMANEVNAAHEA